MANISLAAKYRPQNFSQVVGQDTVKSILSRACEQDKIAPAYLLSGTRGVGKTTLARVFAKTLNCENAPCKEPCNVCDNCKRITQGAFVDVVEIDAASNGRVEDVRKMRETVGYAPLEGRYKVIIIDEAHMLSTAAFNALLKTLEEPPARVVFVLATTEQHKFPITILSRCQQFVFKQVAEFDLEKHLLSVLEKEGIPFEEEGIRLIARRAAGSVRDSMSLLGQCLAFMLSDNEVLTDQKVREVLGLVGLEFMDKLLSALANQDLNKVILLLKDLFLQGIDMSFFLKEFSALWRNLLVLREAGKEALSQMPIRELVRLEEHATQFSLTYIHAAWQMTLDNQRRILQSLEPAAALELLMLNLALLPRLLPLSDLRADNLQQAENSAKQNGEPMSPESQEGGQERGEAVTPFRVVEKGEIHANNASFESGINANFEQNRDAQTSVHYESTAHESTIDESRVDEEALFDFNADFGLSSTENNEGKFTDNFAEYSFIPQYEEERKTPTAPQVTHKKSSYVDPLDALKAEMEKAAKERLEYVHEPTVEKNKSDSLVDKKGNTQSTSTLENTETSKVSNAPPKSSANILHNGQSGQVEQDSFDEAYSDKGVSLADFESQFEDVEGYQEAYTSFSEEAHSQVFPHGEQDLFLHEGQTEQEENFEKVDWEAFMNFCGEKGFPEEYLPYLKLCLAKYNQEECVLNLRTETAKRQLQTVLEKIENFLAEFLGRELKIRYTVEVYERRTLAEMMEAMYEHPQIRLLQREFGANLLRCSDLKRELK